MASPDPDLSATASGPVRATGRIDALDVARGVALGAMALYHATWDLGFLRLTPENYALSPLGKGAAHGIAGSFLVLVGIGLVLVHGGGIRRQAVVVRFARIGGAALAVTAATYALFPDSYVFFGILHCIAVSSVLALPFLFVPVALVAMGAASIIAAPPLLMAAPAPTGGGLLDAPGLFFLGLGRMVPQTNDYVPLFPWFGLVLLGIGVGRLGLPRLAASGLGCWRATSRPGRMVAAAGRHSLAVYLIHQPVLLAVFSGIVALTGPHPRAGEAEFRALYARTCVGTGGEVGACRVAARCVVGAFRRDGLWAQSQRTFTVAERAQAQALSQGCYEAAEGTAPAP
ncbi:heparan-alpha-glucosaminide N-acetyltransferase [Methylobacterium gossipiicola]|uniref:Uncharacterized membrane protein n=1 Tax=Methylobacterium gossipiicola TaxID=582675 RepID=A0A1I2SI51_9HYPH|nr:heparan-alpha-glucosaminide N-acetyltransferase [Methylobacterium gossipiicola]SFG49681.1 Uncharacterized membrane protein [Methylobacterium gossipiicola]